MAASSLELSKSKQKKVSDSNSPDKIKVDLPKQQEVLLDMIDSDFFVRKHMISRQRSESFITS